MPEINPVTSILAELSVRLTSQEFRPFTIVLTNGQRFDVQTRDHLTIRKFSRRIEWETDQPELRLATINPLHVATIEELKPAA